MPLERSGGAQENGAQSGRIKLVLRLDNKGGKAAEAPKDPPAIIERPKRNPKTPPSDDSFYHQKIPKKPGTVVEDASKEKESQEDLRPSRKRKSTMDNDFVFDPIYSKKKDGMEDDEEEDEEDIVDTKKHKKKSHRHGRDTDDWSIATPPLQEEPHSFKLKLKLPKPPPPDTPEQAKSRKVEPGSSDSKKKRKHNDGDVDELENTPRSGNLKVKIKTPEKPDISPPLTRKAKAESVGGSTKKHSPPKKEEPVFEKRELREKPKPNLEPKTPLSEEDSAKMKKHLSNVLSQLIKLDKQQYFMDPVTEDIAPQYFSIIHHPMDFLAMKKKLKNGKYDSVDALQEDFQLICNNCMTYNPATTSYSKEAKRMLNLGNRLLEKFQDVSAGTTTEHKLDDKRKEMEKTPTRQTTPSATPTKATPNKPTNTPNTTPNHPLTRSATAPSTPATPLNNSLGVAFPISSGQLSSMQHPISTTPQHPYPLTPTGLRKPIPTPYPPPPLNANSPYSPRIGAPGMPSAPPSIPSTITRPPPLLPLQKSQSTNSMLPRTPLQPSMPSIPTPTPGRPPAPVGKPGSRPPVVSLVENQATQTQAMFPEQPKRKYVKLPVEEPPKPAPPAVQAKTPAKLVAKVGTTPLVTPANVPGSFVYSMYIPRFESAPTQKSSPTETSTNPNSPPPFNTPSSSNFTNKSYINNYVSVPSLYLPLPPPDSTPLSSDEWRTPSKHSVVENEEVMDAIANDSLSSMDSDSRSQLLKFFEGIAINGLNNESNLNSSNISFPSFATPTLLPRSSLHQQPIRPIHKQPLLAPTPTPPPSSSATPVHAITIPPATTGSHLPSSPTLLPTPPSFLIMDTELSEQMERLDSHDITAQDLKQLQGFQIDLSFLSTLNSSSSFSPASPQTTTTTTTTTTSVSSPLLPESMDITSLLPFSSSSSYSQMVTPPTSPPTSPPVSAARTPVVIQPDPTKARKMAQEVLDKNLEYLWALQLMQHERVASNPSETELKLASQFLDGVFALGTAVPPSMLTSKEAVRAAIDASGLVTGKRRNLRI